MIKVKNKGNKPAQTKATKKYPQQNIKKKTNNANSIHKILHLGTVFLLSLHPSIHPSIHPRTINHTHYIKPHHITPCHFIDPSQLVLYGYEYKYDYLNMEIPPLLNSLFITKTE
ncbi:hypothetical protein EYC84_007567 [Monilinia fructicola]|uniref:Uncharacterized protein n=1 Tax=Monilinia fructicola TaxID=38448 RepID=A0A5M9JIJ3_MONFR|nr:hypothetical protein EYC84_007567 [Monilinia fructicola]